MKVAMYYNNKDVRIEEMPKPVISSEEILVKMKSSGICGSDVLEWYRIKKAPLVLGHEMTGEIAEVGSEVKGFKVGERVFVSHHIPCNTCHYCLGGHHTACHTLHTTNYFPGGFAEYIRIPKLNVDRGIFRLPEELSYDLGTFIEPLACVVRGQRNASFKMGQSVLVLGSGLSGLLHIALAKSSGAGKIFATDMDDYRLKKAKEFGADGVIKASDNVPKKIQELNGGKLVDFVIVCTGAVQAFEQAFSSVDHGGTILFFACTGPDVKIPVSINDIWRNDIKLMPSYGAAPNDLETAIELLCSKRVDCEKMITHRLKLTDAPQGFKLVSEPKESLKVILNS